MGMPKLQRKMHITLVVEEMVNMLPSAYSSTQMLNAVHQDTLQHKFRREYRSKAPNLLFILQLRTLCTADRKADRERHKYCSEYQTLILNKVLGVLSYCMDMSVRFTSYVQASCHNSVINLYARN
jgi:hypothetical protein